MLLLVLNIVRGNVVVDMLKELFIFEMLMLSNAQICEKLPPPVFTIKSGYTFRQVTDDAFNVCAVNVLELYQRSLE